MIGARKRTTATRAHLNSLLQLVVLEGGEWPQVVHRGAHARNKLRSAVRARRTLPQPLRTPTTESSALTALRTAHGARIPKNIRK